MKRFLFLLLSFAIAPLVLGHGLMPMSLSYVMGDWPIWHFVLGPTAIVTLLAGQLMVPSSEFRWRARAHYAGTLLLYLAWLLACLHVAGLNTSSERPNALGSMVLFSLPFQVATLMALNSPWLSRR